MIENKIIVEGIAYAKSNIYLFQDPFTKEWGNREISNYNGYPTELVISNIVNKTIVFELKYQYYFAVNDAKLLQLHLEVGTISVCLNGQIMTFLKSAVSEDYLIANGFTNGINNPEIYYHKVQLKYYDMPKPYRKFDNTVSELLLTQQKEAGLITATEKSKLEIKMGIKSPTYIEFENLKYPFGVELETATGTISEAEAEGLNFKAVHDGSLRGPNGEDPLGGEYVTGVLRGDSGLAQLYDMCRILKQNCTIDNRCGVHVHVGDFCNSKENIVYSYLLGCKIEKSLQSILPKSRRNNSYCRDLDLLFTFEELNELSKASGIEYEHMVNVFYERIFGWVSFDGKHHHKYGRDLNHTNNHPKGSKCQYIKTTQRYCWLNLVTLVFNTRGCNVFTIEMRNHAASLNYNKIKAWIKVCMAFVAYVDNHKNLIKADPISNISVEEVIMKVFKKTGSKLVNYVEERRSVFSKSSEIVDHQDNTIFEKKSIKEIICA